MTRLLLRTPIVEEHAMNHSCFNVGFVLITSSARPLNRLCWSDTEDSKGRLNTQDGMVPFSELYDKSTEVSF
ncbi:hypothetical protein H5410_059264 [Solanum commersonii]|uniref:Uncharacterized protein n=1 Tax=Solanum commersonii TaxID=4109 RepID=A0A9J5W221_SOLCO|nr:hypothetical protein H5410_059264 [Solanum commersonii]